MRGAMDAGKYKHIALLLFLRNVSEAFDRRQTLIVADGGDAEDRDEYLAENTFFVPPAARWVSLVAKSRDARIGVVIDDAMRQIEAENTSLKGALPKVFGKKPTDRAMLIEMIEPTRGRVYDPCCGTGGFFVQSEKSIAPHQGRSDHIAIRGQKRNHTTFGLAETETAVAGRDTRHRRRLSGGGNAT